MTQTAGNYSTNSLNLASGAALGYGTGDTITDSVSLSSGAALTLAKDLSITGSINVDGATTTLASAGNAISAYSLGVNHSANVALDQNLTLTGSLFLGNGGSIARTGETISASRLVVDNSALDLLSGDSFNGSYYPSSVGNGGVVNAAAGASLGTLIVNGVNGSSAPSTFNVNGDVTINGYLQSYSDGIINLNAGTVTAAQGLYFDGVGSVTQTAGNYSTNSLYLSNGAALTYGVGDAITSYVNVSEGSTLTLDQNLALSGYLNLDNGGSISRTTETISALAFNVYNTTLDLVAGDTFNPGYSSYVQYGALVNAPTGTSLGYLSVYGTNGVGDHARFNVNGDVTLAGYAQAYSDGIINLNAGTLTAQSLYLYGAGSVTQTAGNFSTNSLSLSNGAALGYGAGDTITGSVNLSSGAGLTLAKDLAITGGVTIDGATTSLVPAGNNYSTNSLYLSNGAALAYGVGDAITSYVIVSGGSTLTLDQNLALSGYLNLDNGGSISRTTETISALAFNVYNTTLDLVAGDTFNPGYSSYVQYGALVNAPTGTSLGYLSVYGTNGVGDHARFNVNGDVTLAGYAQAYSDGIINLNAGTLTAQSLYLYGAGSVTQAGGHYATASMNLSSGVSVAFLAGDSVDRLSVDGAGSVFDEQFPLTLLSMALTNSGVLHLNAFTGSGAVSNWALRLNGNDQSLLETLIAGGSITGAVSPLVVTYDAGSDSTYVSIAAVPEPSTYAMAFVGLACGGWQMVRRRRARSCARSE